MREREVVEEILLVWGAEGRSDAMEDEESRREASRQR